MAKIIEMGPRGGGSEENPKKTTKPYEGNLVNIQGAQRENWQRKLDRVNLIIETLDEKILKLNRDLDNPMLAHEREDNQKKRAKLKEKRDGWYKERNQLQGLLQK